MDKLLILAFRTCNMRELQILYLFFVVRFTFAVTQKCVTPEPDEQVLKTAEGV